MVRVTQDDLLAAIDTLGKELPKRPPGTGWKTVRQMAQEKGISLTAMRQRFRVAMDRGLKVEEFIGSDYGPNGRLGKQTWFRVKS